MTDKPLVRVILGSVSDEAHGAKIKQALEEFGVPYDYFISSAHRKPEATSALARNAETDGIRVIIAAAGMAAHLPGVIASQTTLPVIGVPLSGSALAGVDALYAVVQMPPGIPVATVAVDGGRNAGMLAVEILALTEPSLKKKLVDFREKLASA